MVFALSEQATSCTCEALSQATQADVQANATVFEASDAVVPAE